MLDIDSGAASNPAFAGWEAAGLRAPDMDAVRAWRLQQLRDQLEAEDLAGIVLFDPLNIRYAVDATNMLMMRHSSADSVRWVQPGW